MLIESFELNQGFVFIKKSFYLKKQSISTTS